MFREIAELVKPPRTLYVRFPFGSPIGKPNDINQQLNVLLEAIDLFETADRAGIIKDSAIKYR
jgi:hypothetical protein